MIKLTFKEWIENDSAFYTLYRNYNIPNYYLDKKNIVFTLYGKDKKGYWGLWDYVNDPEGKLHKFKKWENVCKWIENNTDTNIDEMSVKFQEHLDVK